MPRFVGYRLPLRMNDIPIMGAEASPVAAVIGSGARYSGDTISAATHDIPLMGAEASPVAPR
jgi:hypothetical protein